jgi:hypothetical protein
MTQRTCTDCGVSSHEADSQYTLIKEGWRVVQAQGAANKSAGEWRCSACWAAYKGRPSGAHRFAIPASSSVPPVSTVERESGGTPSAPAAGPDSVRRR